MKNVIFRSCAAVLALLLATPALVSCGDTADEPEQTTAAVAESSTQTAEVTTAEPDPFAEVNYKDEEFNFFAWEQSTTEYDAAEQTGDMIKDAVYKRNRRVEEKLGVKLKYEVYGMYKDYYGKANASIASGTHAWDALACYSRTASLLMLGGQLKNLLETEYIDFDQACWPEKMVELNTLDGKLYFASGDIATSLLYQMMFMAINNDLAADLNKTGVQEKALKGEWTLDYFLELCKDVYSSKDGTNRSYQDRFGLMQYSHTMLDLFYLGSGLNYVDVNKDGSIEVSEDLRGEISMDLQDKLKKLFWSGTSADGYYTENSEELKNMLTSGNCLFYVIDGIKLQTYLTQSTYSYSILCAPKYNADQENYYTAVGFPHSMYCIPTDASDDSMSGAVIEYMAETSYDIVSPAVFDTAFKYRYSQGTGDSTMFDIIRSGVVFDFGRTLFDQMGGDTNGPVRKWRDCIASSQAASFTTITKALWSTWTKSLDKTVASIVSK